MKPGFCLDSPPIIGHLLLSESSLQKKGGRGEDTSSATYVRVVRTGVARAQRGSRNHTLIQVPFLFLVLGTVTLGGLNATRAYRKQNEAYPSHNPFVP